MDIHISAGISGLLSAQKLNTMKKRHGPHKDRAILQNGSTSYDSCNQ
jgi:hypothetical protein